jgi:hypothetical protein
LVKVGLSRTLAKVLSPIQNLSPLPWPNQLSYYLSNSELQVSKVAQASFQWRYLVSLIQDLPLAEVSSETLKHLGRKRWNNSGSWLLVTSGMAALVFWNGRLVLATSVGVATMAIAYLLQDGQWQWPDLRTWLKGWNRQFLLTVTSGSVATLGTYLIASIWAETTSHWIATLLILQGAATLGMVGMLLWQSLAPAIALPATNLNDLLPDLTAIDPLKRLIAIHRITEILEQPATDRSHHRQMANYFRLMLSHEDQPIVREALLEGLQATGSAMAPSAAQPLVMPMAKYSHRAKVESEPSLVELDR